ncbi:urea transporter [Pseudomonas sp. LPB0260]|uniref:urea transporter n=1 Tax=Pseudomonas sp. LPB0260 TaxID=2614442 RepID=UPI0015C1EB7D|nr:urea transporter [Pseudomonas sp. LPB0260]QLC72123.1 urea transporter [Pseudomonas sp. LPB0260]QLC74901.1 urea transporter [Pseudomonas sp. LPB0260]
MHELPSPHHALRGLRALLNGFSQVLLQSHPGFGLLLVLGLAAEAPALLGGALLGGLSGMLTAQRRGYPQADIEIGLYGYNGILLGLLISLQFAWSLIVPLLIIASAGLSSLILAPWMQGMRKRRWLPAFTFPFVALSWLLLSLAPAMGLQAQPGPLVTAATLDWLGTLSGMALGLAQVIFLDSPWAGLLMLLGLFLAARRAACWALLGSACGLGLALLLGAPQERALAGLYGYNGALAAIALSQVQRRPWVVLLGIGMATLLQLGLSSLGLQALTLPFILACWLIQTGAQGWQRAVKAGVPGRQSH